MRLTLPVPPSWNRSYRMGRGNIFTPDAIVAFRQRVLVIGRNARIRKIPREIPVRVTMWWYRKAKQGDLDKRASVCLDALQGVWISDDAQVAELHLYRYEDKVNPRLEVEVEPMARQAAA